MSTTTKAAADLLPGDTFYHRTSGPSRTLRVRFILPHPQIPSVLHAHCENPLTKVRERIAISTP